MTMMTSSWERPLTFSMFNLSMLVSQCRLHDLISVSSHSQIPTLPRSYRERERDRERESDRERERLRRESETEEEEERERVLGEVSDGEESDDTAYDRRHTIPPCDLP